MKSEIFLAILWPPALNLARDIEKEIRKYYDIQSSVLYKMDKPSFKRFMFKTYEPDKTPIKRVKKKYNAMKRDDRSVKIISIVVPSPTMLPHKKTRLKGTFYCQEMKRLKKIVRTKFSPKIKGYIYDILIHISDNQDHNKRTKALSKKYGAIID